MIYRLRNRLLASTVYKHVGIQLLGYTTAGVVCTSFPSPTGNAIKKGGKTVEDKARLSELSENEIVNRKRKNKENCPWYHQGGVALKDVYMLVKSCQKTQGEW